MSKYPPIPLNLPTIELIKQILDVSAEEACTHESVRRFMSATAMPIDDTVQKEDRTIEIDNIKVDISIVRPLEYKNKVLPVILLLHGGGWAFGDYSAFSAFISELVNRANACLVFVHYSLSPEVKHPVALEECYAALCWIQKNANSLNIDSSRLAVAGDSAGGNLSAALTLLSKQRGNTGISQQVLFYPVTDSNFETSTYEEYKDDIFLDRAMMKHVWEVYVRNKEDYDLPLLAPLKSTVEELKGLPPALIINAEIDVLRDDGEAYARKLKKAGVNTISTRYNNVRHAFVTLATPTICPEGILAIQQTVNWLKKEWKTESKL
ncbi:hypothetical protein G6F56_004582 [Rhizopus delemar]|uniref:Alpha/beta hydrolase fold-3 domain-containing protein n=1 Tax=Rhizopus stolonifer TaxID=4846 RepID=A0A367KAI2_RHIST|nr:hypothetical protein G6F56_004582 [Rhizopus delemar]RCH99224.1 hypothetical protein CU098_010996 [Rhizopus stolonifer]